MNLLIISQALAVLGGIVLVAIVAYRAGWNDAAGVK